VLVGVAEEEVVVVLLVVIVLLVVVVLLDVVVVVVEPQLLPLWTYPPTTVAKLGLTSVLPYASDASPICSSIQSLHDFWTYICTTRYLHIITPPKELYWLRSEGIVDWRVLALTYPLPAAFVLPGRPRNTLTLGFFELLAQVSQVLKLKLPPWTEQ
jgi:hypothetical protein